LASGGTYNCGSAAHGRAPRGLGGKATRSPGRTRTWCAGAAATTCALHVRGRAGGPRRTPAPRVRAYSTTVPGGDVVRSARPGRLARARAMCASNTIEGWGWPWHVERPGHVARSAGAAGSTARRRGERSLGFAGAGREKESMERESA
jgi:hypothetical protein